MTSSELLYNSRPDRNTAQKRWRLLARALTRSPDPLDDESQGENEEISVRRFTSFDLLHPVHLENEPECTWWLYTGCRLDGELHEVLVRRISKCFTANELIGFNNTGNVCVWPSEECLAYYLLKVILRKRKNFEMMGFEFPCTLIRCTDCADLLNIGYIFDTVIGLFQANELNSI